MVTWVYDEIGCAGAIVDEYCVRNLSGDTVAWIFGVSLFSLKGEHIGWYEDGVFYDIQNRVLGFLAGAKGLEPDMPALVPEPPLPRFSKRPYVPTLRGRAARPIGRGWSGFSLQSYLEYGAAPRAPFLPRAGTAVHGAGCELSH